ncbi:MAG: hypothetical protein QME49_08110 [bacterium]|nr:hypothetical protein [bacterium]
MEKITVIVKHDKFSKMGNWDGAKELFPTITVNQETAEVTVTYYSVANSSRGQWGCTHEHTEEISEDGQTVRISGITGLRNDRRQTGGRQNFCYFVFRGDTNHLYIHRASATKGWLTCPVNDIKKRLVKMGIGATTRVVQQGDFLLKPANGSAYEDSEFRHETTGAGHHRFEMPVLYATGEKGRQYNITEPTKLIHTATDGLQHPDVTVPVGIWIVGTTSNGLFHLGQKD